MINRIRGMRGIALAALLAGGATLHAQVTTPSLTSLQSGPAGNFDNIPAPVYGAAITAGTPSAQTGTYDESGAGFFLYINGAFNPENFNESATWTALGTPTSLNVLSTADNQIIAFVPQSLFASAGSATITVTETETEGTPAPVGGIGGWAAPPPSNTSNGLTFTVNAAMASIASLPPGDVGLAYSQPFFTGGTSPFTLASLTAPAGLNYTATTGNPLFGTPTTAGLAQTVSAIITDEWGNQFTPQDQVSINPAPQITTTGLSSALVNVLYPNTTLMEMGGTAPYVWTATGLPAGLSLNTGGVLSGSPTATGPFTAVVTLTDNLLDTAQARFPFNIYSVLTVTPTTLSNVMVNTAYPSTTLTSTGGTAPYTWHATGLPTGMTLSTAGSLSGTPTVSGPFTANITLTDGSSQTALAQFPFTVYAVLTVTPTTLSNVLVNTAYPSTTLTSTGGTAPYTWHATGLPTGMTLSTAGSLSGTPTVSGPFTANITLTDGSSQTALAQFPFTVYAVLTVTPTTLSNVLVNTAYPSTTLTSTGGASPYTWHATGLPTGMTLSTAGSLSGTPTVSGPFTANITLTDGSSQTALAQFPFTVYAVLTVTPTTLSNVLVNTAYPSTTLTSTGGTSPYSWHATGLPTGMTLSTAGSLSGTPTVSGPFTANITLTDGSSQTALAQFPFTVYAVLTVTPTTLSNVLVNTAYPSTTLTSTGGASPYTWHATGLPTGMTLSTAGSLSGTPTVSGPFTANITLTDGSSQTALAQFPFTVYAVLTVTPTTLSNVLVNTAYPSTTLTSTGGTAPYTWHATGLPTGMTLSTAGSLSGTPTVSGPFTANITLTDGSSQTALAQFPFTVYAVLTVTPTTLSNVLVNTAYPSTTLTSTGGASPYTWHATGLPTGMTLSTAGSLSGTPTVSGPFTANITLTDGSSQTALAQFPFTVYAVLTVTPTTLANVVINTAYPSTTLASTGGASPYTWHATGLPTGMTLSTAGSLSGTPTVSGPFTANITLTDGSSQTALAQFPFTVYAVLTVTPTTLSNVLVNTAYPSTTLASTGGTSPYSWHAMGLPTGMTLSTAGILSGTPTVSGPFTANITLTDGSSQTALAQFPFTVYAVLTVTPTTLASVVVNTAYPSTTLTSTGGAPPYNWHATGLPTGMTLSTAGVLSGTPTVSGSFTAHITLTDGSSQTAYAQFPFAVYAILTISPAVLPTGQVGQVYNNPLSGSGGLPPYTWVATGLPPGLSMNAASGSISGNPTQNGSYVASITLTDRSGQTAKAAFDLNINSAPPPPVNITTSSLPNATVGVQYSSPLTASGGNGGPYTFTGPGTGSGHLPPGMQVASVGLLQGIPTAPGNFSFTVTAADSAGNSGSGNVSITIVAAPLLITTGALTSVQAGALFSVTFTATGGVSPYTFSLGGSGLTGANLTSGGAFTWTPPTPGSYSFTVSVTDSAKTTVSKSFTLVVTPASLVISATLPTGTAGSAYSGQFAATGGTPPYSWSGSAGGGLSVSSTGAVSGTPTAAGTYSVSVTVTDSLGVKATGSFPVTVNPSSLTVTTSTLPNGALTSAYSASVSATGGTPPYTWTATGLPDGISLSTTGTLSGTPTAQGAFTVGVTVKDSTGVSASANLALTISAAPLKITPASIPSATVGAPYSASFAATGGAPPYTWTAPGLPAGLSISSTGALSGTPTAPGTFSITVNAADSNGLQASETLSLTVALPPAPAVTFTGLPPTASPATQSSAAVTFSVTYPVAVTVNLTLTFAPASGADDPNIQFSTGGRTATLTVPAGATASSATIGVQTGTVAGTITITSQLLAAGQDITPTPAPTRTIVIAPAVPSITSLTASTNSTGFSVTVDGFDTTRAITQVVFTFTPAAGSNLQTTSVTIPAGTLFSSWYQSSASAPYGSQFSFTIPFTVTGNVQSIASVTVTLVNPTGTSASMTTTL